MWQEANINVADKWRVPVLGDLNEGVISLEEGFPVECLKKGGMAVLEWLVRLLNLSFDMGFVPMDWRGACIERLYEGVIVPTALFGAEARGMRSAERRKVNVLEMNCLRSLVGVPRMDRVRTRAVIERDLASRADGFGIWKEWTSIVWPEGF